MAMIGLFDTPLYKGRRNILVNQLKAKGSFNERILRAIAAVPRHIFVMEGMEEFAYNDTPVAIEAGQTISQPSTVALQTQLLGLFDNPTSTDGIRQSPRVLEIGTGCGYQSAVLFYLGAEVFTIERQEELYKQARKNLVKAGYLFDNEQEDIQSSEQEYISNPITDKIHLHLGDGYLGLPDMAPFDGIVVTCGANEIPNSLLHQLKVGAKMVIPVGEKLYTVERESSELFQKKEQGNANFVPMLKGVVKY